MTSEAMSPGVTTTSLDDVSVNAVVAESQALSVRDGQLWMEEIDLAEITERFPTPVFLMSEAQLRSNARRYREAFEQTWSRGKVEILSALKAHPHVALRRILNEEDLGCDIFGFPELAVALAAGVPADRISVNGSSKSEELIHRAVDIGAYLVIDSSRELHVAIGAATELGTVAKVRLRVRPDLDISGESDLIPGGMAIRDAAARYKPGISADELLETATIADRSAHVDVCGIHIHSGRHTADPALRVAVLRSALQKIRELRTVLGSDWCPSEIDLGGGYAVRRDPPGRGLRRNAARRHDQWAPAIEEYASVITDALAEGLDELNVDSRDIKLMLEPGRSLFGDAGVHLSRVANVKRQSAPPRFTWLELDTSQWFMMHGIVESSRWPVIVVDKADQPYVEIADLVGCSCTVDRLVPDVPVPEVERGDVIALLDMGCYETASSSNFNKMPRPGTVLVSGDKAAWITMPETLEEVMRRDKIPDWLTQPGDRGAQAPSLEFEQPSV